MKTIFLLIVFSALFWNQAIQAQYDGPLDTIIEENEENIVKLPPSRIEPMPYLSSCTAISDNFRDRKAASDKKMLTYIYTNIVYPDSAITTGTEGTVILSFTIKKDGWVDTNNIKIIRDIGHGCGEEARRVIQSFNKVLGKWSFHNEPTDVRYTIPLRFRFH